MRIDGRANDALRPITISPDYLDFAEGSVMITWGKTQVLCAASVEENVPPWLRGQGRGWVTGEYAMPLDPRTAPAKRCTQRGGVEIRRMIGRFASRHHLTRWRADDLMCVIQATAARHAAITGGCGRASPAAIGRAVPPTFDRCDAVSVGW